MRNDDIVASFVRQVRALRPEMSADALIGFEVDLRREWGGRRVYVTKDRPSDRAERPMSDDRRRGAPKVSTAARSAGSRGRARRMARPMALTRTRSTYMVAIFQNTVMV